MATPPLLCKTGKVKSMEVEPQIPNAVFLYRLTMIGISIIAANSRIKSLKNAVLPITGPNASVSTIPDKEYQPYPDAMANPIFIGNPSK